MHVDQRMYAQAWYESLKTAPKKDWDRISANLMRRLQKEGKLSWLKHIQRELIDFIMLDENTIQAQVTVAHDLSDKYIDTLVKELLGDVNVDLTINKDPNLLGGVVVETKDTRYDMSLNRSLERLRHNLTT